MPSSMGKWIKKVSIQLYFKIILIKSLEMIPRGETNYSWKNISDIHAILCFKNTHSEKASPPPRPIYKFTDLAKGEFWRSQPWLYPLLFHLALHHSLVPERTDYDRQNCYYLMEKWKTFRERGILYLVITGYLDKCTFSEKSYRIKVKDTGLLVGLWSTQLMVLSLGKGPAWFGDISLEVPELSFPIFSSY